MCGPADHPWVRATGGTITRSPFPYILVCSNQLPLDHRACESAKYFSSLFLSSLADQALRILCLARHSRGPLFLSMLGGSALLHTLRCRSKHRPNSASWRRDGRWDGSASAGLPRGTIPRFRHSAEFEGLRQRVKPGSAPRRCPFGYST